MEHRNPNDDPTLISLTTTILLSLQFPKYSGPIDIPLKTHYSLLCLIPMTQDIGLKYSVQKSISTRVHDHRCLMMNTQPGFVNKSIATFYEKVIKRGKLQLKEKDYNKKRNSVNKEKNGNGSITNTKDIRKKHGARNFKNN